LVELVQPDIILLDFRRSLESGRELARAIHLRWPNTWVVLIVRMHQESQNDKADAGSRICYFLKDISEEEFGEAITRLANQIRAERSPRKEGKKLEEARQVAKIRRREPPPLPVAARPQNDEFLTRELLMAGRIQADILPEHSPSIPGWEIASRLESARETSGDFYDFIPLANNHWGVVVADVTDKGMGAALFMALTSTLLRTYSVRYPTLPGLAMDIVNDRILSDTRGSMFVTAFYGVLEPHTGRLRYVNAGHPPACLVSTHRSKPVDRLGPTGKALGLIENSHWQQKICRLYTGDVLVLYTDGVTEAQNPQGEFFGEGRLMDIIRSKSSSTAEQIQEAVLAAVHSFVADTPRQDDIAIIVIRKTS
jgi:serine phosphatase RsbU (regulator of sigma subunit)